MEAWIILLVVVIISFAFFGESVFGFGGGLISIPLLSLIIGVKDAVTLVLIFQLLMGLLIWKTYKFIDWKVARPITYTLIPATILGTLLLSSSNVIFLQLFLAVVIILFLVKSELFSSITLGKGKDARWAYGAGLGGGLLQGLIGAGGPILTMYTSVAIDKKTAVRATLIYLFFFPSVVRVLISLPQQLFTAKVIWLGVISLPFFLAAIYLGHKAHHKISEKYYRLSINVILGFSALVLLTKTFL